MILTCTHCSARYLIDPASIGEEGRRVRCAQCGHTWFEEPPQAPYVPPPDLAEPAPRPLPIPEGSALPVVVKPRGISPGMIAVLTMLTLFAVFTALALHPQKVLPHAPFLASVYHLLGYDDVSGLAVTDIAIEKLPSLKHDRFALSCNIENRTKIDRPLPIMHIALLDAAGKAVFTSDNLLPRHQVIGAGKKQPCGKVQLERTGPAKEAKKLRIDIGSPIDIMLRD